MAMSSCPLPENDGASSNIESSLSARRSGSGPSGKDKEDPVPEGLDALYSQWINFDTQREHIGYVISHLRFDLAHGIHDFWRVFGLGADIVGGVSKVQDFVDSSAKVPFWSFGARSDEYTVSHI